MTESNGEPVADLKKLMALRVLRNIGESRTVIHADDPSRMTVYGRHKLTGEPCAIEFRYNPNINLFHDV